MTIQEMHIGLDVAQRTLNSNHFQKLEKEEKDFVLNKAIVEIVKKAIPTVENQLNNVDDDTIRQQYNVLDAVLVEKEFVDFIHEDKYIEFTLPKIIREQVQSGSLFAGYRYRVVSSGTTNLTSFGCPDNTPGFEFDYLPDNLVFALDGTFKMNPVIGGRYRIKRLGVIDFTNYGASKNEVGVVFTSTVNLISNATMTDAELEVISTPPVWDGVTTLAIAKKLDVFEVIRTASLVYTSCSFSTGVIRKGYYYKVSIGGIISNLTDFGSEYNTVEPGYIFLCTKDGAPNWASSGVRLTELMLSSNRLPAVKDINNALTHPIGTLASSPITTRIGGNLRVYHDNKFDIHKVIVTYIRTPMRVNSIQGVNCDLNEAIHDDIVDKAASYILATQGSPNYQAVKTEEMQ